MTIGGLPFSGFGNKTSTWHTSTHELHPVHRSGLITTGVFGVGTLGKAYIVFSVIISSLSSINTCIVFIVCLVIFFEITPVIERFFHYLDLIIFQFDIDKLVPLRRV